MSLTEQLAAHDERVQAAKTRAREVDLEVRAAAAKVEEARNEVIEAHADGDDAKATKLGKALAASEDNARRLREEKLAGVTRAVTRAEADRQRYATENFAGLVAEKRPEAAKVVQAFEDNVAQLQEHHAAWRTMYAEVSALARLAGRDTRDIPDFPTDLEHLMRSVDRLGGINVPPPLPPVGTSQVGGSRRLSEGVQRSVDPDPGVIDLTNPA